MNIRNINQQYLCESFEKLESSINSFSLSLIKCQKIGIKNSYLFEESEAFDSLTSKFARISDIFIQKILRTIFILLHEGTLTIIDMANNAEKLNIVKNADILLIIRDLRNQISHEYEDENLNSIYNQIFEHSQRLLEDIKLTKLFAKKYNWIS